MADQWWTSFDIPDPGAGQWKQVTETFTTASGGAYLGKPITVKFFVSTSNNNQAANFDVTPVPEPATVFSGGVGLIVLAYVARRRLFGR